MYLYIERVTLSLKHICEDILLGVVHVKLFFYQQLFISCF